MFLKTAKIQGSDYALPSTKVYIVICQINHTFEDEETNIHWHFAGSIKIVPKENT